MKENKANFGVASKWRRFFKTWLLKLRAEDELEMRVELRQSMGLPLDPVDEKKLNLIKQRETVMIKEQSPQISYPHISLHLMRTFWKSNDVRSEKNVEKTPKEKETKSQVSLSDNDVQLLFEKYENLDSKRKNMLFEFMEFLEKSDPKHYQRLLQLPLQ